MGRRAQLDEDAVDARGREVPLEQTPVGQRPVRQRQIRQRDLGDCPLGEVRPLQLWEVEAEQVEEEEGEEEEETTSTNGTTDLSDAKDATSGSIFVSAQVSALVLAIGTIGGFLTHMVYM